MPHSYIKDFDRWNEKKKQVNEKDIGRTLFLHEREVWWCSLGVNVGVEIDGKNENFERPVLIVKKFNGLMFWGIPLTSRAKKHHYVVQVSHQKGISYANISQMKLLSSQRILRKIGVISESSFQEVLENLRSCW